MPHYEQAFYIMAETVSYFYYFAMARSAWAEYITHTESFFNLLKSAVAWHIGARRQTDDNTL